MRILLPLVLLLMACPYGWSEPERDLNDEVISKRIEQMSNEVVNPRYDKIVRSYLRTYTILDREKAERILGHQIMYFPIFEEYLRKYHLPDDLKYLAVVESALIPDIVSRAGARGLWQFMPVTGTYFGLTINETIDERCDVYKSTEAAMKYLSRLYDRFQDWELAIAAYNSGGGRVSRAMKRARSKDFWQVKSYLPRETANYVPAFIAASYLMQYYQAHDLEPKYPNLDLQLTERTPIHQELPFYEIAQVTQLPMDVIEYLNPAYEKGFIPSTHQGMPLVLPTRVMKKMKDWIDHGQNDPEWMREVFSTPIFQSLPERELNLAYAPLAFTLKSGQSIHQLAMSLGCTVQQLMLWNNLTPERVRPGMELIAFRPAEEKIRRDRQQFTASPTLPGRSYTRTLKPQPENIYEKKINRFLHQGEFLFFWVEREMTAYELATMLPGISIQDVMRYNKFDDAQQKLKPDDKIKIKKR